MLRTKFLLFILCLIFPTVWCYAAERVAVSVVFSSDLDAYQQAWNGFKEFLGEKKVSFGVSEYHLKEEESEQFYSTINQEKPDIVITLGTKASKLAKEKIKDIPVVFCMVFNPREITGLNITGVSMEIPVETKIKGIKKILPNAKRIGLIYSTESAPDHEEISRVCGLIGFTLFAKKIDSEEGLPGALKDISGQIDCFMMIPDSKIYSPMSVKHLLLESLRKEFPVFGLSSSYTKAGALFSFDCDYADLGRQAAEITLRILNGEKPSDIAPSVPKKIKLSLNRSVAERLGIEIPSQIIKESSKVFGE